MSQETDPREREFGKALWDALSGIHGDKSIDEMASHLKIQVDKFRGYLKGTWTPSLHTFAWMTKRLPLEQIATLVLLCYRQR